MTEHEFTQVAANMIKKSFPGYQVEIAGDLPPFGADGQGLYMYEMELLKRKFIKD